MPLYIYEWCLLVKTRSFYGQVVDPPGGRVKQFFQKMKDKRKDFYIGGAENAKFPVEMWRISSNIFIGTNFSWHHLALFTKQFTNFRQSTNEMWSKTFPRTYLPGLKVLGQTKPLGLQLSFTYKNNSGVLTAK